MARGSPSALAQPFTIGTITLPNRLILGPMAGTTDLSFRTLCHEMGAGLVCGEMVSAKAVIYRNKNTAALCRTSPEEHPVSLQLFGSEPEIMAQAAEILKETYDYDLLDINMGCPVAKIVSNGEGSALMKDPALIERIVDHVVRAAGCPVTVKLRKGYGKDENTAVRCAKAAEAGGASLVTIHGRTREQFYSGQADWSVIRQVKDALAIPVAGSGDVTDGPSCAKMFSETGCDAVMIARATQGNPWIFREILTWLTEGETPAGPTREETVAMLLRHARLLVADKGDYIGIREMRRHAAWYTKGIPGAARLRENLSQIETMEELEDLCRKL